VSHTQWIENLRYSIEVFSASGSLTEVLVRAHDLPSARAAYEILPKEVREKVNLPLPRRAGPAPK
jgi:hypothetical protein